MTSTGRHIPVYVFTGFLGSGKTTLLRSILQDPRFQHVALIVNEFGTIALDHHLLRSSAERVSLIGGGCACCQVRDDLVSELKNVLTADEKGSDPLQAVIIETTGLADPAPILFTILTDPVLQHHFCIGGVFVTVDAVHGKSQLQHQPESVKQVLVGDRLILTKTDLVDPYMVNELRQTLQNLNPTASILLAANGQIEVEQLLNTLEPSVNTLIARTNTEAQHTSGTETISVTFAETVHWQEFMVWLSLLLHAHGESVLRVKGMIDVREKGPVLLQGVQHVIHPPEHLPEWPAGGGRSSTLTFILRGIPSESLHHSLRVFGAYFGGVS